MLVFKLKQLYENLESAISDVYQSLLSFVKVLYLSSTKNKIPKVEAKECIVLGNGPSLKTSLSESLDIIKSKDLICVNSFPLSEQWERLKPTKLVLLDPAFFLPEFENMLPVVQSTLEALVKKTSWSVTVYLPAIAKGKSLLQRLNRNKNLKVVFYNYTTVAGLKPVSFFLFQKGLGMPLCQNVLSASIFLAINSGYKKIWILGADHSWMKDLNVDKENNLLIGDTHFYEDKPQMVSLSKSKVNMAAFSQIMLKVFKVYYILNEYARSQGVDVYNASQSSLIDAFPKVDLK